MGNGENGRVKGNGGMPLEHNNGILWEGNETRKLVSANGEDILRWGYRSKDMFTIEEGYFLKSNNHHNIAVPIWKKIWGAKFWPKVEYFLWLLSHRKILTWDHLQHRGIQGPSLCMMCKNEEETIEHLFNPCKLAKDIWQNNEAIFEQTDRTIQE